MSIESAIVVTERIAEKIRVAGGGDDVDLRPMENILTVVTSRKAAREALARHFQLLGCKLFNELARLLEHVWHYGDGDFGSAGAYSALYVDTPERVRWLKRLAYRASIMEIDMAWARKVLHRKMWVRSMPERFRVEFADLFLSE